MDYIPSIVWFFGKTFVCIFLALWVRWSFRVCVSTSCSAWSGRC